MKRLGYLVLIYLLGYGLLPAQVVDARTFFRGGPDPSATTPATALSPLPGFGPLERLELRTETDEFDTRRQEYTLRITPAGRGKVRAQRSLAQHLQSKPDFTAEEASCDILEQRYADWLSLFRVERELAILDTLLLVQVDEATVLRRRTASLDFAWSDLIDLRKAQTDLNLRQASLRTYRSRLLERNGFAGATLDFGEFLRAADVLASLAGITVPNTADPETAYDLETVRREMVLERTENRQYLDFGQFRYRGPHDNPFAERFSVGIGLQLRNSGDRKIKLRELAIDDRELNRELTQGQEERERAFTQTLLRVRAGAEILTSLRSSYAAEAADLAAIRTQLSRKLGADPLPMLNIRERELRNRLRTVDAYGELLEDYLELLMVAGQLCQAPEGSLLLR